MRAVKKNNLRFYYLLYILIMTVIGTVVFSIALKVDYYQNFLFKIIFILLIVKFIIQIIYFIKQLIKISKDEDNKNIDEREFFIMSRAAATGGIVAFTLMPFIYIFIFISPKYLSIVAVIYVLIIDLTINISSIVYIKKI